LTVNQCLRIRRQPLNESRCRAINDNNSKNN